MKLLLCRGCHDVFKLASEVRHCACGKISGAYNDELYGWYRGELAVPLGFENSSLAAAIRNQPKEGLGERFTAFVIAKTCETFERKS